MTKSSGGLPTLKNILRGGPGYTIANSLNEKSKAAVNVLNSEIKTSQVFKPSRDKYLGWMGFLKRAPESRIERVKSIITGFNSLRRPAFRIIKLRGIRLEPDYVVFLWFFVWVQYHDKDNVECRLFAATHDNDFHVYHQISTRAYEGFMASNNVELKLTTPQQLRETGLIREDLITGVGNTPIQNPVPTVPMPRARTRQNNIRTIFSSSEGIMDHAQATKELKKGTLNATIAARRNNNRQRLHALRMPEYPVLANQNQNQNQIQNQNQSSNQNQSNNNTNQNSNGGGSRTNKKIPKKSQQKPLRFSDTINYPSGKLRRGLKRNSFVDIQK